MELRDNQLDPDVIELPGQRTASVDRYTISFRGRGLGRGACGHGSAARAPPGPIRVTEQKAVGEIIMFPNGCGVVTTDAIAMRLGIEKTEMVRRRAPRIADPGKTSINMPRLTGPPR